ncbi:MAG: thioredoxin domain-containing protein [Planctomycetota bacterium]
MTLDSAWRPRWTRYPIPSLILLSLGIAACAQEAPHEPQHRNVNRLDKETSPYLRQHRHNPVDWYPWGLEALERAKKDDKPIFLSIGYSACHWCHVMERESFENEEIARLMNENFVCIKVDREERPDLDEIYMAAVQAMTGQGGWPMSVWLTPDLEPFYGGTYFPPDDRHGRPGFRRIVVELGKAWKEQREKVLAGGAELSAHLRKVMAPRFPSGEISEEGVSALRASLEERFDPLEGGFAGEPHAPKFPHASELRVLLRLGGAGDRKALSMARLSLDRMIGGGIHDQIGGGFHRYSTDRQWLVPHFEKMLYDNALLAVALIEGHLATGEPDYRAAAVDMLDYMIRELQGADGGFCSSQDADSGGEEGAFFVWTKEEIVRVCGELAPIAVRRFGVREQGDFEGLNILRRAASVEEIAEAEGKSPSEVEAALARCRALLLAARDRRVHPGLDDKVLTSWNALAIDAMSRGYQILGDERYLASARRAASFLLSRLVADGRCLRSWCKGAAKQPGFLEDHAGLAGALCRLFECDGDPRWLEAASGLLRAVREHFAAEDGGFYSTADDHEALPVRSRSPGESSTPSGTALAVDALLRAGLLLGDLDLYEAGLDALRANAAFLARMAAGVPTLVLAQQWHLSDPVEVVVAGDRSDERTMALLRAAWRRWPQGVVAVAVGPGNREALERLSPLFAGKVEIGGVPAAYPCRRGVCDAPVTSPDALFPKR